MNTRTRQYPRQPIPSRRGETGFATVFVLILAMGACTLLTAAMQAQYRVHDQTRRELRTVQTRAQALRPAATNAAAHREATP
jgi:hypothetical protein